MHNLNCIFNNPNILKVFHGANMDMLWLHRDFDIRVANLFDTYQGARQLGHKQLSYAYLLKHYTNVDTDKKYQLADWRLRPLTEEMLLYARIDTHYLLEIYDKIKVDIYKRSVETQLDYVQNLRSVFNNSDDVAAITFKDIVFRYS
jgi:exosome complex exonuclease RRP6